MTSQSCFSRHDVILWICGIFFMVALGGAIFGIGKPWFNLFIIIYLFLFTYLFDWCLRRVQANFFRTTTNEKISSFVLLSLGIPTKDAVLLQVLSSLGYFCFNYSGIMRLCEFKK